jgi:VCBS repeat protein/FG-GAP repeat protein
MRRITLRSLNAAALALTIIAGLACGSSGATGTGGGGGTSGNATTTRSLHVMSTTPASVSSATAGDLVQTGTASLVTVNDEGASSSTVTVWKLGANGTLQPSSNLVLSGAARAVAHGDIAGDGKIEVIVGSSDSDGGRVTVLGSTGGESLRVESSNEVAGADLVQVADLNGDGRADVIAASRSTGAVTALLGQADGSLKASGTWLLGGLPTSLATIDVDGDGSVDIVAQTIGTSSGSGLVVLMGNGAGSFDHLASIASNGTVTIDGIAVPLPLGKSLPLPTSKEPAPSGGGWSLIAGDFNADGRTDLALTSAAGIELLLGKEHGGFDVTNAGPTASAITPIDFENDGYSQIAATADTASGLTTTVLLASLSGSLRTVASANATGSAYGLVAGDFNGDGYEDLAVVTTSSITMLLNTSASASASAN